MVDENESKNIQILKGLAIACVVFIHNTPIDINQIYIRPFLNFSVGLFLFISGYLSTSVLTEYKYIFFKRLKKVLVPYVFWTFIYVVLYSLYDPIEIPIKFLRCLITANSAVMMYFIPVYCQFTLLLPVIELLASSKYCCIGLLVSFLEIFLFRTIPLYLGFQHNIYFSLVLKLSCACWFSYFYLGYLLGGNISLLLL